jgi:hypothetical protein
MPEEVERARAYFQGADFGTVLTKVHGVVRDTLTRLSAHR